MSGYTFTKNDWVLFKNKIAGWQESYIQKLNKEYIELLNGDANPSEKFWELEKRLNADKKKPGVLLQISRSNLIFDIVSLINDGVIGIDDIDEFSGELKETISAILNRQKLESY